MQRKQLQRLLAKKTATKTAAKKTATKTAAKKTASKDCCKEDLLQSHLKKRLQQKKLTVNQVRKLLKYLMMVLIGQSSRKEFKLLVQKQTDEFDKLIDENFVDTYSESVIVGTVVNITEREAIIDINAKSEGVISLNEFRYNPELAVGDSVEVIVDIQEDKTGQLVFSHRKARTIKAWERVIDAHDKETVVTGFVKCRTKGGMIVDVFGLRSIFTWFSN